MATKKKKLFPLKKKKIKVDPIMELRQDIAYVLHRFVSCITNDPFHKPVQRFDIENLHNLVEDAILRKQRTESDSTRFNIF